MHPNLQAGELMIAADGLSSMPSTCQPASAALLEHSPAAGTDVRPELWAFRPTC